MLTASVRLAALAMFDAVRGAVGLPPCNSGVFGRPGRAIFADPAFAELFDNVQRSAPTWRNSVTLRFLFTAPRCHGGTMQRITADLMVTLARDDEVISDAFVKARAEPAAQREIRVYPARHFEMYHGAMRAQVATDHLRFIGALKRRGANRPRLIDDDG